MRIGILSIIISSLVLTACQKTQLQFGQPDATPVMHDNLGNVRENMQLEPLAPISKTAPKQKAKTQLSAKPSVETTATAPKNPISPPATVKQEQEVATTTTWQPNEALLIRGTELLLGLQSELGKKPTILQMQNRLQTHMGLNMAQANQLIAQVGMKD